MCSVRALGAMFEVLSWWHVQCAESVIEVNNGAPVGVQCADSMHCSLCKTEGMFSVSDF